jgi:hypothetical protein
LKKIYLIFVKIPFDIFFIKKQKAFENYKPKIEEGPQGVTTKVGQKKTLPK